jgi:NADH-quinone oxidoreductase subunit M
MFGAWNSDPAVHNVTRIWVVTMLAATGVIWAAVYLLWMLQRVLFGRVTHPENRRLPDLNWREIGLLAPLLVLMLYMGAYPRPFLARARASVEAVRARVVAGGAQGVFHAEARETE